ncbi:single-stranded DNA-binding protein WHY2, mitochondrial [Amaranthus tricolor]|uniref:single-stranded DNA-binding protein WHY2, mitochondrial n=1 Tax=Amaranthus tricolor TaxID=29722 RepID=UPI002582D3F4|nr:single-stranded DNA-binding protein WHY2, mitochondrial [Amaranthus tricolor]
MMKLANLFKSRSIISRKLNHYNSTQDVFRSHSHALMSHANISTVGQKAFTNERIYAGYSVYKGKTAFSAEPVPPEFIKVDSGIRIKRQGYIMLSFSPSVGERKYDWQKKQRFALSATEVGSLIALGPAGSCEFFHDPAMKTSNAGQVRKSLSIKANPEGTGYFFSLNVVNNTLKTNERLTLPVSSAEFAVMRTSFSYALPHIMGWDRYSSQHRRYEEGTIMKGGEKTLHSEWSR